MKVLITGGAGFIGSYLCEYFLKNNYLVTVLDNLSTGSLNNINHLKEKLKFIESDIRDKFIVEELVKSTDIVIHLAAAVGVKTIINNPVESISSNFSGSEIVLKASAKFNKRIIIASTSEIYGKNLHQPLHELSDRVMGTPQNIRWSYADAKALEEALAHSLYMSVGLKVTTVRLFNTVGSRQSSRYGMVIPSFVQSAMRNQPLTIYGDGFQSRVFCHIRDIVEAFALITNSEKTIGQVYNVGGTTEIKIVDLANLVLKITASSSKIVYIDYEKAYGYGFEDMKKRIPDVSKIRKDLGWEAKLGIEKIIEDVMLDYAG